ncbi:MAG: sporulation membrane protein YtaF [Defluviitaleaceae bacterium]|nr:sporulation membrane protein YtaF [Defluviitaleaceae bacterium]
MIEAAILAAIVSLDALAATFAYGSKKIKIPRMSGYIINLICTGVMGFSFLLGSILAQYISSSFAMIISFVILFAIGLIKLLDSITKSIIRKHTDLNKELELSLFNFKLILHLYANPEAADVDASECLSTKEATVLAISLSLDGFAVGFGAALLGINGWAVVLFALIANGLAIWLGGWLGNTAAQRLRVNISWLAGLVLIMLAITRLF